MRQRLEKLLESSAIKMSSVIADIMGMSGRRMLNALIDGVDDPEQLAALADYRVKASADDLREALTGRFTDHHGFLAKTQLDLIDSYTTQIDAINTRIDTCFASNDHDDEDTAARKSDLATKRDLLTTIPGISTTTAEKVLAEIGADMTVFLTAKHLTSWAGIAPGANESAGKVKSSRCRPGNTYLKGALGIAAMSASRTKDTFLATRYKRIASRRGHTRALVAHERTMLTIIHTVLTTGQSYHDLGGDYYIKRRPGPIVAKAINQLRTAGINITFTTPTEAMVT
jgi:transposase